MVPLTRIASDPTSPRGERWAPSVLIRWRGGRERADTLVIAFAKTTAYPPEFSLIPRRTSSTSEEETEGTCSPSEDFATATRVLLKRVSAPARLVASPPELSASPAGLFASPAG